MGNAYTHGHQEAVLRSHRWRTAENSAAYLLPSVRPGQRLLDMGCGPGNITLDLAARVTPGEVVGIDASAGVIAEAEQRRLDADVANVRFEVEDIYDLEAPDSSFDVVHAHQVLQHLSDPVAALAEARRVLVVEGVLGVRDADYAAFAWAPRSAGLDRWNEVYHAVTRTNEAEADAGRHLHEWVRAAGFIDVTVSSSTWTFATPDDRVWWGGLWADRCLTSSFADQAVEYELSTTEELAELADAWRDWATHDDATFIVVHGEVLARR